MITPKRTLSAGLGVGVGFGFGLTSCGTVVSRYLCPVPTGAPVPTTSGVSPDLPPSISLASLVIYGSAFLFPRAASIAACISALVAVPTTSVPCILLNISLVLHYYHQT